MAARLWRLLVGCAMVAAAAAVAALCGLFAISTRAALLTGFGMAACAPAAFVAASFAAAAARGERRWSVADVGHLTRAFLSEIVHFNQAVLTMVAPARRHPAAAARVTTRPVLLIHGILCNHSVWNAWLLRLEAAGFGPLHVVDLEPLLADIETHAVRIEQDLRALFRESGGHAVNIVAHSMGGLVARAALRRVGPGMIERIVTIATPHHGSVLARPFGWQPLRQLCPQSPWLRRLNACQERDTGTTITSIYSLEDNLVVPARSAALANAQSIELRGMGHLGILFSPETIDRTLAALAGGMTS